MKNAQNIDVVKRISNLVSTVFAIMGFVARNLGNLPPVTFDLLDVSVLFLMKIDSLDDKLLLMKSAMKWQQTTSETLTKVY